MWCIWKISKIMCRFTCQSLVCNMVKIHQSIVKNVRKNNGFHLLSTFLPWIFSTLQIRGCKVNLHVIVHLFPIHHFVVWSIPKYLSRVVLVICWHFCQGIGVLALDFDYHLGALIKYWGIDHTTKRCIQNRCTITFRFTLQSLICNAVKTHGRTVDNRRKSLFYCTFFAVLWWMFTISQIGDQEVNLRIIFDIFHIHHLVVWSIAKYLIALEVLMGFAKRNSILALDYLPRSITTRVL